MAKCDIDIVFEKSERQFVVGEKVNLRVVVTADEPVKFNALLFEVRWRTHGRGDVNTGTRLATTIFEGDFEPGERTFELDFLAPNGPLTYRGELLNVDWEVFVQADIPWAIDPKFSQDFVIHGPADVDYYSGPVAPTNSGSVRLNPVVPLVVASGLVFSTAVSVVVMQNAGDEIEPGIIAAVVVIMCLTGVFLTWVLFGKAIRASLAERSLGAVQVDMDSAYRVGDTVAVKLSFTPNRTVIMNAAHVVFTHHEWVRWRAGTNTYTKTNELMVEHVELVPGVYNTGQPVEMVAEFVIPPGSAQTFGASNNKVQWLADIEFDLKGSADWNKRLEFSVLPEQHQLAAAAANTGVDSADAVPLVAAAATAGLAATNSSSALAQPVVDTADTVPVDPDGSPSSTGEVLVAGPKRIIDLVSDLPTFGLLSNEQEARVVALQRVTFRLQFKVHEVDQTFTAERPELAGGQTVRGRLSEGVEIRVQLSPQYDESVVEVGKTVFVIATVARWDAIARTMVLCEVTE